MEYLEDHQYIDHLLTKASILKEDRSYSRHTLAQRLRNILDLANLDNVAMNMNNVALNELLQAELDQLEANHDS